MLNSTPLTKCPHNIYTYIPAGFGRARFQSVNLYQENGMEKLMLTGFVFPQGTFQSTPLLMALDVNQLSDLDNSTIDNLGNHQQILPIATNADRESLENLVFSDGFFYVTSTALMNESASTANRRHKDFDILVRQIQYNPNTEPNEDAFTILNTNTFNSIQWTAVDFMDLSANTNVYNTGEGNIFTDFHPNVFSDLYPYGPKYLNLPFARDFDNCNEVTATTGLDYIEDWSNGSEDVPFTIMATENQIVVSCLLNRMPLFSGQNITLGNDVGTVLPWLECVTSTIACEFDFGRNTYLWGEAYLLFINKETLALEQASHLGTFTGGDYEVKAVQTPDGGFAVVGTTTSCPQGLDVVGEEEILVVKVDADGTVEWRQNYKGPNEGSCGFGIDVASDGGLIVGGNSDGEAGDEFLLIKIGLDDCEKNGITVVPNNGTDYILQASETWSKDHLVTCRVVVPDGLELRINNNATIRFSDSRKVYSIENRTPIGIVVERGGKLRVDNATLTGQICDGSEAMWDGISAEGQPDLEQTQANQGFVSIFSSVIRNARFGVTASSLEIETTVETQTLPSGTIGELHSSELVTSSNTGGGKIFTFFSNFIDNHIGLNFEPYDHNSNSSIAFLTNFRSTGPLADPDFSIQSGSSFNGNIPLGTLKHVQITGTKMDFSGCNFMGSTEISPEHRAIGIEGTDAKINVTANSTMTDLLCGVRGMGMVGSIFANAFIRNTTFNNVARGIELQGSAFDEIRNCDFLNIPTAVEFPQTNPIGVCAVTAIAPRIVGNHFEGANPNELAYGLWVNETGFQGAEVIENTFDNTQIGNQFENDNQQLSARCNDYMNLGSAGWTVPNGVLGEQGSSDQDGQKADNEFFDACNPVLTNHIQSNISFIYNDKTGNENHVNSECVSEDVIVNLANNSSDLECITPTPPCDNPPCESIEVFEVSEKSLNDRNETIRTALHQGFDENDEAMPAKYDDVIAILEMRDEPEDKILLASTYYKMGDYQEAQNVLNSLEEDLPYSIFINNLVQSNQQIEELPTSFYVSELDSDNLSEKRIAQKLEYYQKGAYHIINPLISEYSGQQGYIGGINIENTSNFEMIKVSPNPFSENVKFEIQNADFDNSYKIEIFDFLGRKVWQSNFDYNNTIIWNTQNLQIGTFYYLVYDLSNQIVYQNKLIKQ